MRERTCISSDCVKPLHARGYCDRHYRRLLSWGSVDDRARPTKLPEARFWPKVDAEGPCWLWTGSLAGGGYGWFMESKGKSIPAHRWAYIHLVGPVPEDLDLDHLCRVRRCVNPDHLEPVTRKENAIRGAGGRLNASKTHCPKGHPYAGENLLITEGRRRCRACTYEVKRRSALKRAKAKEAQ